MPANELPTFIYGTAWKEDETQRLTQLAIRQGFRAIDTANQRKHYFEAGVGAAMKELIEAGEITRDDLFLQTKFTFQPGQDERLPYDPKAPTGEQVEQSFESSLEHLGVDAVDSYVLHGPLYREGLSDEDWQAWRAMEAIYRLKGIKQLGISNVSLDQLKLLVEDAVVPPAFVQNRCFAAQGWDHHVRQFCLANEIAYQGFSLLTANPGALSSPLVRDLATKYERSIAQIIFRFAKDIGMIPLTGTTNADHMQADLAISDFTLAPEEVAAIERVQVA